ncbi:TPA: hypothetical protein ACXK4S_000683 [Pseudomonas aeruginosa]
MNAATQANNDAQATENKGNTESFKAKYDDVLSLQGVQPGAKNLAESILDIMRDQRVPAGFDKVYAELQDALNRKDNKAIAEISNKLTSLQSAEAANAKSLVDLKKKHTFADVLQAFTEEFEELAYKISHKTLTTTHALITEASKAKGTRRSKASSESESYEGEGEKTKRNNKRSIYKITKADGTVVDFPIVMGADGNTNYKKAEEGYKALGFEVIQDAETKEYSIEPGTIEMKDGSNVMVSRTNMIEAIEKQTAAMFDGWTAKKVQID